MKAYALISSPNTEFDEDHVLVLCQLQKYKAGQLYMYQRMELYDEIIQYHMENNEPDMVIKACKSYAYSPTPISVLSGPFSPIISSFLVIPIMTRN